MIDMLVLVVPIDTRARQVGLIMSALLATTRQEQLDDSTAVWCLVSYITTGDLRHHFLET